MTRSARILLVDDEAAIQRSLGPLLEVRGFEVDSAMTGRAALEAVKQSPPDLIILDLTLPDLDGRQLCAHLRADSDVPIIVVSARHAEADKIAALDQGADDYLTKPFSIEELLARIRVALRRTFTAHGDSPAELRRGDLTIDFAKHRVRQGPHEIRLTPKEFDLLAYLARHPNQVLTHQTILSAVWGPQRQGRPEQLWVLVRQLRKKVEPDPSRPRYVLSEPWVGYRFAFDAD